MISIRAWTANPNMDSRSARTADQCMDSRSVHGQLIRPWTANPRMDSARGRLLCWGKMKQCFLSLPAAPARGDNTGREVKSPLLGPTRTQVLHPGAPRRKDHCPWTPHPALWHIPIFNPRNALNLCHSTGQRSGSAPPRRTKHPVACLPCSVCVWDQLGNLAPCSVPKKK